MENPRQSAPEPCPCGCGLSLPEPMQLPADQVADAIEGWVAAQGLTMVQLKSPNRSPYMVEARRRVVLFLRAHQWSLPAIGRFIDRDHTTVMHLLAGRPKAAVVVDAG